MRIIIGFFDAAVWTGNIKLMVGWWPESRRASIMGIILAAYSLAITADFAVGIPLTIAFGWRTFFGVLAVLTLVIGVLDLIWVRDNPQDIGIKDFVWEPAKPIASARASLLEIFKSRWIYVGALGIGGCTFALSGTATWVIPTFIKVQGMPVGRCGADRNGDGAVASGIPRHRRLRHRLDGQSSGGYQIWRIPGRARRTWPSC